MAGGTGIAEFRAAAKAMAYLSQGSTDPEVGADATAAPMYLYRYIPDFAGGSVDRAKELAEVMTIAFAKHEAAEQLHRTLEQEALA